MWLSPGAAGPVAATTVSGCRFTPLPTISGRSWHGSGTVSSANLRRLSAPGEIPSAGLSARAVTLAGLGGSGLAFGDFHNELCRLGGAELTKSRRMAILAVVFALIGLSTLPYVHTPIQSVFAIVGIVAAVIVGIIARRERRRSRER